MGDDSFLQDALAGAVRENLEEFVDLLALRIDGVEATQAIQYSRADRHLTDPADRGADNSVRLVAYKPAWVRVYLRSGVGAPLVGVTGELTVYRRQLGFLWTEVAKLAPQPPGSATAEVDPDYALERSTLAASLNFVVPADLFHGNIRLELALEAAGTTYKTSRTLDVDARLQQTLRMRVVPVSYDGPDAAGTGTLQLSAPSLADAQDTASWSLLVYPVSSTPDITLIGSVGLTFPLTGAPANKGGCAQSWKDLNVLVKAAIVADGNQPDTIYYGLVASGVPLGSNSGCKPSGIAGKKTTMAHELGHVLGFPHAPCGGVSSDTDFPAYEPYDANGVPGGSIGEYGLDIDTGFVHSPTTDRDYMSYCKPRWISLLNYGRSVGHELLDPLYVSDEPWWWDYALSDPFWEYKDPPDPPDWFEDIIERPTDRREPVVSLIGVRHHTGEFEVRSITRALAAPVVSDGVRTEFTAELVDERGQRLAAAPVYRIPTLGGCCGPGDGAEDDDTWLFQALIRDAGVGAALHITVAGEERWQRAAPERPPEVRSFAARIDDGRLSVEWQLSDEDRDCEVWIRATGAQSRDPRVLHVMPGSGRAMLDVTSLPPGPAEIELIVHDGFRVTTSEPAPIEVSGRPPTLAILHPYNHRTLIAGRPLRLHGLATDPQGEAVDPAQCSWLLDNVEVARGLDVWTTAPAAGAHRAQLICESELGRTERAVGFRTVRVEGG